MKYLKKAFQEKKIIHGLGLWEVRKIIKKNSNANLYTSKTDKLFSQQIELY
ncbi:MAG: GHKL domain-containing protein [Lachnospiraceae bacterium]|nr:GHKL domain-containing protein [Lachnospiraceae bacterium]